MITAERLLERVRLELNDPIPEGDEPRWATAELLVYANDAVRDYSKYFPRTDRLVVDASGVAVGPDGGYALTLTAAVGRIARVGYQETGRLSWIQERPLEPGDTVGGVTTLAFRRVGAGGYRSVPSYELSAPEASEDEPVTVRLNFAPRAGSSLVVDYTHAHAVFDPADPSAPTTVPDDDEELLSLYTTAKAWARVGGQDAGLSRWDEGGGRRDDSPIIPRENRLFRAYRYKITDRQGASPRAMRLRRSG